MSTSRVRLVLPAVPGGPGALVEIDGEDHTAAIRAVTVHAGAVQPTEVTLQLAYAGTEVDGEARLYLAAAQVGLLARFGWSPPEGYEMNGQGDVLLRRPLSATPKDGTDG